MRDLIERRAAIDALWKALYEYEDKTEKQFQESDDLDVGDWMVHRIFVQNMSDIDRKTILQLPSAQLESIKINIDHELTKDEYERLHKDLADAPIVLMPSAQPEILACGEGELTAQPERTGRWIPQDHNKKHGNITTCMYYYPVCSECGHTGDFGMNYCPNCGADMRTAKCGTEIDLCVMDEVGGGA